jgi:2-amino-4-hydroxy-6-hydroxymethyldihydropteridine diphosphokinase
VIVGVGTNLGAREAAIRAAGDLLASRPGIDVVRTSSFYETAPLGPPQGRYLNAAYRLETALSPPALLQVLLRTERRMGRRRRVDQRWGPRSVDLDLLWDFRGPFTTPSLAVPHRELDKRDFALGPLLDVAPELEDQLGDTLEKLGGRPPLFDRRALIDRRVVDGALEIQVEADSAPDACALALHVFADGVRPWSTRHLVVAPTPHGFAKGVRELFEAGFAVRRCTMSHCSETQWRVEAHGVNQGAPPGANVRFQTTPGTRRAMCVSLRVSERQR